MGTKISLNNFSRYAWSVLLYNLVVILWGAYVRASGSGAGCGSHWPLCNGEILPMTGRIETLVEFTHRLSSGLAFLSIFILLLWAYRVYPKKHHVRLGANLAMVFVVSEALVGAGLVLLQWVGEDASTGRAVTISIHLVNTFLLLASLCLTAWWSSGGKPIDLRRQGIALWGLIVGLVAVLLLGMTGAITALGDTLFPAGSLTEGFRQDLSPGVHFLIRLRVIHPVIAIIAGFYIFFLAGMFGMFRSELWIRRMSKILAGIFLVQLAAGLINLVLLAPIWMQLTHLFLADLVWISLVLLSANVLASSKDSMVEVKAMAMPLVDSIRLEGGR